MTILPVIFGTDIADYSFARIFHESFGVRSLVVGEFHRGPIDNSSILDLRLVPKGTSTNEEAFIACLDEIAAEHPDEELILLVNTDQGVEFVAAHREHLAERWFLPYGSLEAVARANSKGQMAEIYTSLGLHIPARTVVDVGAPTTWEAQLGQIRFPIVLKPENGRDLDENWGKGLRKVLAIDTPAEALERLRSLNDAGVAVRLIAQELIPGDDTTQWVVNGYVDSRGEATTCGSGRVLLGLHAPQLLGNAAAILVTPNEQLQRDAIRVIEKVGLRGFFSMDVKIDPRDGKAYWLDLNPRIGRSHYYLKIGGIDQARAVVNDMRGVRAELQTNTKVGVYSVIPRQLLTRRYIGKELLAEVRRAGRPIHPLAYARDRHSKRTIYRYQNLANQWRNMRRWYPKPTDSGF